MRKCGEQRHGEKERESGAPGTGAGGPLQCVEVGCVAGHPSAEQISVLQACAEDHGAANGEPTQEQTVG